MSHSLPSALGEHDDGKVSTKSKKAVMIIRLYFMGPSAFSGGELEGGRGFGELPITV